MNKKILAFMSVMSLLSVICWGCGNKTESNNDNSEASILDDSASDNADKNLSDDISDSENSKDTKENNDKKDTSGGKDTKEDENDNSVNNENSDRSSSDNISEAENDDGSVDNVMKGSEKRNIESENENDNVSDVSEGSEERNIVNSVKVNISCESGSTAEAYEAISDIELNRPSILKPNEVFLGWVEDEKIDQITDKTIDISDVIEISVDSVDITDDPNVIFNDAVYVETDIPTTFSVPISVGGETGFSVLDMEIEYDSSLLEFVEFQNADPDLICNCVAEESKIYISFSSTSVITAELDLCDIVFKTKDQKSTETSLKYNVTDMAAWDDNTSDFYNVKYSVVDGKIVMY